jgi:hypothetical protein
MNRNMIKKLTPIFVMLTCLAIIPTPVPAVPSQAGLKPQSMNSSIVNLAIGAWIIIAGDRSDHDDFEGIKNGCNQTYAALISMGYTASQIYYLSPDTGDGGVLNTTTVANIQYAIVTWAGAKVSSTVGLGIYLEDHGGNHVMATQGTLSGIHDSEINASLATLQSRTGLQNIIIIYDACHAGSFISVLSGPGRIILTSTDIDHNSPGTWPGLGNPLGRTLWGHTIWTQIMANKTLADAFKEATWNVRQHFSDEFPLIDDNGDRVGHRCHSDWWLPSGGDGYVAMNTKIRRVNAAIFRPTISVIPQHFYWNISKPNLPIYAVISNLTQIKSVYATLILKNLTMDNTIDNDGYYTRAKILFMQNITLTDKNHLGNFTGMFNITSFKQDQYRINIYAETIDGGFSTIESTYCTLNQNGSAPADTTPPSISILCPENGITVNGAINISAYGNDDQALDSLQIYVDQVLVKNASLAATYPYPFVLYQWDTTSTTPGSHEIKAVAKDKAGHQNVTTANAYVGTIPSAPQQVTATAGDATITLTWTAPLNTGWLPIDGYKIFKSTASGSETLFTTTGNVLTWTDTGLVNGQAYYYVISAVNTQGDGAQSSEASATPSSGTSSIPGYPIECTIGIIAIAMLGIAIVQKKKCKIAIL